MKAQKVALEKFFYFNIFSNNRDYFQILHEHFNIDLIFERHLGVLRIPQTNAVAIIAAIRTSQTDAVDI